MTAAEEQFVKDRLKSERIITGAEAVADGLAEDGYSLLDYQPGDGTSYKLAFARCMNPSRAWCADENDTWVVVSWQNRGCYPFELYAEGSFWDQGYIMEKLGAGPAGAIAMAALLTAICSQLTTAARAAFEADNEH